MVFALPIAVVAVEAAVEAAVVVGSAALAAVAINEVAQNVAKDRAKAEPQTAVPCPLERQPCPPCVPPVGTVAYEIHTDHTHYPCDAHIHWFRQNQHPIECYCFWQRNFKKPTCLEPGEDPASKIPPGAVPI